MKRFLIIALSLIAIKSIGQVKQGSSTGSTSTPHFNVTYTDNSKDKWPPLVYVNSSLKYRSIPQIDPNDIASINIKKGKDYVNKTDGIISIELKKKNVHFITIDELTQKCVPGFDAKKQAAVYVIDDKLIDDASNVAFESSYIKNIEILDYSKGHHTGPLSNVIVFKIYTQAAPVYVEGTSSDASIDR